MYFLFYFPFGVCVDSLDKDLCSVTTKDYSYYSSIDVRSYSVFVSLKFNISCLFYTFCSKGNSNKKTNTGYGAGTVRRL